MIYFQDIIAKLQNFWGENGCAILQPYDMEVGAGTSNPNTILRCLGKKPWHVAYVQPCRRPNDGRYGENPNRMQYYYQFQVLLKPAPADIQELCLRSLQELGVSAQTHDLRFVEDNWENPTLGAWGLGWELWCDGMEILQFTYMQQVGGIECELIPGELTYGLERLATYLQNKNKVWDIEWNKNGLTYGDVFLRAEKEHSAYNFEYADTQMLLQHFMDAEQECANLLAAKLCLPAYDQCLKAGHIFNILDARGVLSVTERASYISRVRNIARGCCEEWLRDNQNN